MLFLTIEVQHLVFLYVFNDLLRKRCSPGTRAAPVPLSYSILYSELMQIAHLDAKCNQPTNKKGGEGEHRKDNHSHQQQAAS